MVRADMTVNLSDRAGSVQLAVAGWEDAPVAKVARRAVVDFLSREAPSFEQRNLLLTSSPDYREAVR